MKISEVGKDLHMGNKWDFFIAYEEQYGKLTEVTEHAVKTMMEHFGVEDREYIEDVIRRNINDELFFQNPSWADGI